MGGAELQRVDLDTKGGCGASAEGLSDGASWPPKQASGGDIKYANLPMYFFSNSPVETVSDLETLEL